MCTLFANLYMLLMWGPNMVSLGSPYIFNISVIKFGWLGNSRGKKIVCNERTF